MTARFITIIAAAGLGAAPVVAQDSADGERFISDVPDVAAFDGDGYTSTDGEVLYDTFCAGCHMPDGEGAEGAGAYPALRDNPLLEFAGYPISLIVNGQGGMPALGHLLSDEQVLAVTGYIQANLGNGYEPDGTLQMVADIRPAETPQPLAEHEIEDESGEDVSDATVDPSREDAAEGDTGDEADAPNPMDAAETSGDGASSGSGMPDERAEDAGAGDGAAREMSGVVRHGLPNSTFPISMAAEIPPDATLVYLSGTVPEAVNADAPEGSAERYGDTAAQTQTTLASIEDKLRSLDLDMGDVVKMQVFLVAPAGADGMDFAGFMDGYTQFFGTDDQPMLPTRSVLEVSGLANPSWLVEIEVVAVRP